MNQKWKYFLALLMLAGVSIWLAVLITPKSTLKIIACDVGQGDAFLIVRGNTQIIVDGGPGNKIDNCLSKYIPFWDRTIEMVILSHPQADHYMGLIDVFKNYNVEYFLANSLDSSSQSYQVLENLVGGTSTKVVNPSSGMAIRLGLIYLDVLWPSKIFLETNLFTNPEKTENISERNINSNLLGAYTTNIDPNEFSIVVLLKYNEFKAIFTGDIGNELADEIADEILFRNYNPVDYLKVSHHGSKNGMTLKLLESLNPKVAVISVGKNNSYGHPSGEVLDMLDDNQVKTYRTDELGSVILETDGEKVEVKN